jgi:hypothetical protein
MRQRYNIRGRSGEKLISRWFWGDVGADVGREEDIGTNPTSAPVMIGVFSGLGIYLW